MTVIIRFPGVKSLRQFLLTLLLVGLAAFPQLRIGLVRSTVAPAAVECSPSTCCSCGKARRVVPRKRCGHKKKHRKEAVRSKICGA